jgi:hypothetical protein
MAKKAPAKKDGAKAASGRMSWFDEKSHKPLIDQYAQQLQTYITTIEDGKVTDAELKAQEKRLIDLMKEVEPLLDDAVHEKVTRLLCELTAYDLMQMLHQAQKDRPRTVFQG